MTDRSSRTRWIAFWLALAALLLVVAAAALGFLRGRAAVSDLSTQLEQLQSADQPSVTLFEWADDEVREIVAGLRGIRLPEEADALLLARQGEVRPYYWLRLSLPQTSLAGLLDSTCLPGLNADTLPAFAYGADADVIANLPWWRPEAAGRPAGAACVDATGIAFRLLADVGGAAATVYLEIAPARR